MPTFGSDTFSPNTVRPSRISGGTGTVISFPSRRTVNWSGLPGVPVLIRAASSSQFATVAPSIRSTTSPFRRPARDAGVSGSTSPIFVVSDGTPPRKTIQNTRMAKSRLQTGPAATTAIFTQIGLLLKERSDCSGGTSSVSLSPTSLTYPPSGHRGDQVLRFAPLDAEQLRTEPEGELGDPHPEFPGHDEVAELVDEDENPEDDDEREEIDHDEEGLLLLDILSLASWRESVSASRTSLRVLAANEPAHPDNTRSTTRTMSVNPIRRDRNALTASSLAPFSTAGAVPPVSAAAYASGRAGNRFRSGDSKPHALHSMRAQAGQFHREPLGVAERVPDGDPHVGDPHLGEDAAVAELHHRVDHRLGVDQHVDAVEGGGRRARWPRSPRAPCSSASRSPRRSSRPSARRGVPAPPGPWRTASAPTVRLRNGPPEAVRMTRRMSSLRLPPDGLEHRGMLAVDGKDLRPAPARRGGQELPRHHEELLVRQGDPLPRLRRRDHGTDATRCRRPPRGRCRRSARTRLPSSPAPRRGCASRGGAPSGATPRRLPRGRRRRGGRCAQGRPAPGRWSPRTGRSPGTAGGTAR